MLQEASSGWVYLMVGLIQEVLSETGLNLNIFNTCIYPTIFLMKVYVAFVNIFTSVWFCFISLESQAKCKGLDCTKNCTCTHFC